MKVKILFLLLLCLGCRQPYDPDKDPDVLHWEIIDDSLHIYTKQDSIRDELARWKYIRSLDHDSLWE